MKPFIAFSLITLTFFNAFSQSEYFDGPETAIVGRTINYYYNGSSGGDGSWNTTSSAATITYSDADMATVRINSQGSFYLTHTNSIDGYKELFIRTYTTLPAPPAPFIASSQCGQVTIEMNTTNMLPDTEWYWQTSSVGQTTNLGTHYQYNVTSNATYYLQARSTYDGTWGSTSTGLPVTVTPRPSAPSNGGSSRCGPGSITLTTTPGSNGNSLKWYSAATGGTAVHTGTSYPIQNLSVTTTYYASTYNTSNGCESTTRATVTATIIPPPNPGVLSSSSPLDQVCIGDALQIRVTGNEGTPYFWISSNNGASWDMEDASNLGNPFNYTFTTTGLWLIRTISQGAGGCWSTSEETLQINVLARPSDPTNRQGGSTCGPGNVTLRATPPTGTSLRWYATLTSTNVLSTESEYSPHITQTTDYYVCAFNSSTLCESTRLPVRATYIPPPAAPTVSNYHRMGPGIAPLTASGGPPGSGYNWYWPDGSSITTGPDYPTDHIEANKTNYLYVKTEYPTDCESGERWVNIVIEPLPQITATPPYIIRGANVIMQATTGYTTYVWENEDTDVQVATGPTHTTNIPATYSVTVTKTGVFGEGSTTLKLMRELDGQNQNYIVSNAVQVPGIQDETSLETLQAASLQQSVQYFDDLGRLVQVVNTQGSPDKKDVVQPYAYDAFGRKDKQYLPFVSTDETGRYKADPIGLESGNYSTSDQYQFYQTEANVAHDKFPFSETLFESSPLNRVLKKGGPGEEWQPDPDPANRNDNSVKMLYEGNTTGEVLVFRYDKTTGMISVSEIPEEMYYGPNTLRKTIIFDEHNNITIQYQDKQGRTLCKKNEYKKESGVSSYASTYYVYDDYGNLVVVLQPEGIRLLTE